MKRNERTLFTLNDKQKELLSRIDLCKTATEEVVKIISKLSSDGDIKIETAKELIYAAAKKYEDNEKDMNKIYDKICIDYNLTPDEITRLDINPVNGVVRIIDKTYDEHEMSNRRFRRIWR